MRKRREGLIIRAAAVSKGQCPALSAFIDKLRARALIAKAKHGVHPSVKNIEKQVISVVKIRVSKLTKDFYSRKIFTNFSEST